MNFLKSGGKVANFGQDADVNVLYKVARAAPKNILECASLQSLVWRVVSQTILDLVSISFVDLVAR